MGQIIISNARSKEYRKIVHMPGLKSVYMEIFTFVGVSVIEILVFNQKTKQKQKNMENL